MGSLDKTLDRITVEQQYIELLEKRIEQLQTALASAASVTASERRRRPKRVPRYGRTLFLLC